MKTVSGLAALLALAALTLAPAARAADGKKESKIAVVAAENFYGDIARQIGGDRVTVVSIMSNPDQDPHLFETTPGIVRQIAGAQIVVFSGADYDPWMEKLLQRGAAARTAEVIVAADSSPSKPGDNPHLWYDPDDHARRRQGARRRFRAADRARTRTTTPRGSATFEASLKPLNDKIAAIRGKYAGAAVTASEPVFG